MCANSLNLHHAMLRFNKNLFHVESCLSFLSSRVALPVILSCIIPSCQKFHTGFTHSTNGTNDWSVAGREDTKEVENYSK